MYLPFLALLVIVLAVLLLRNRESERRAVILRRTAFGLMAFVTALIAAFVIGESFTDPGGWEAAGLVAAWAIPLVALGALAWFRPGWAVWAFGVLIGVAIGLSVWFAVDPDGWRSFEDRNGPVRSIGVFVLGAAIALLGLRRTRAAGTMLLLLGTVPVLVASLSDGGPGTAVLYAISSAPVLAGALFLWSAAEVSRSSRGPTLGAGSQPSPA